jgi:glycosyltransferase involved in cell wall biosynthesis
MMDGRIQKIVIIGSAWPLRGGLATYNERLARAFLNEGEEVEMYTFSLQYPGFLFPGKTQYSAEPAPDDIIIHSIINSINPFNWIITGLKIRKSKPDLVIIKFWIPFMAPCLGTIARIIRSNNYSKIISIIDNIIPHEKHFGDWLLGRYWVKSADGFVVMSRSVLNDLASFDKNKPKTYCPHPLYDNFGSVISKDEAKDQLGLDHTFNYLLFFGFIRDYKGLDLLLNAFADERFRKLPLKLLVAGEFYTDPKPYTDLVKTLNLDNDVIMNNNFIADSEVYKYFCAADLVVQPYKHATQSGVTQIAYHFNRPMIITDVGGLAEFVPDGKVGYVVKPDKLNIADAILKFYKENKGNEFTLNVIEEKEKYSWGRMLETINNLKKQLN